MDFDEKNSCEEEEQRKEIINLCKCEEFSLLGGAISATWIKILISCTSM